MAEISSYPLVRHLQASPTSHIRRLKRGKVVADGVGQSFWFRPLGAAISEIPTEEIENSMLFRARSSDFQEVSVQATITFRIANPALAAARIDFLISAPGFDGASGLTQLLLGVDDRHGPSEVEALDPVGAAGGHVLQLRRCLDAFGDHGQPESVPDREECIDHRGVDVGVLAADGRNEAAVDLQSVDGELAKVRH